MIPFQINRVVEPAISETFFNLSSSIASPDITEGAGSR